MADEFDVSDFMRSKPDIYETTCYNKAGQEVQESSVGICAKTIQNKSSEKLTYYVKHGKGTLFDPWGMYEGREKQVNWKFKKVTDEVFDFYMRYLKTRNTNFLAQAERRTIEF